MHWIIQDNLYREDGIIRLLESLERMEIPHTIVKVVPFSADLPEDQQTIPPIALDNPIMVCGSITLANIAKRRGWIPGSFFNDNHDYRVWREHYQQHLLNADARVCRFADVPPIWSPMFIRPCADSKSFSGVVTDWPEFIEWREKVISLHETYTTLDADTMVMFSPVKQIRKEYRFFIVDGEVVGQSVYKLGSRVIYNKDVDQEAIDFANAMIRLWQPARAFALDVALLDDGLRVIEINCINSAGLYAMDTQKFVAAIEAMRF